MVIGLAMSGGGALGAAHIGLLEELERHHVRVDTICGTSAGAIIGLLFAAGGTPAIHQFLANLERAGLINRKLGLVPPLPDLLFAEVRSALAAAVSVSTFADLPVAFSCVATDISTGEMVDLDAGNVVDAVMASSAYPGVFALQSIGGRWLADGGITRNLPADVVRARGADLVIGSSLYAVPPFPLHGRKPRMSRLKMVARAVEIMEREFSRQQMTHCDYCFTPPVEIFTWFDFNQVDGIIALGRRHAQERIGELLALIPEGAGVK